VATFTKLKLSGSTNGRAILVAATATAGTLLHTATAVSGELDEVWLYVHNTSVAAVTLTVEWGGVTSPNDTLVVSVPAQSGLLLVVPGLVLDGGVVARAFAGTTNVLTILGFVNRIVP
jgi:hypothetical protein